MFKFIVFLIFNKTPYMKYLMNRTTCVPPPSRGGTGWVGRWEIVSYFAKLSGYRTTHIQRNYKVTKRSNQIFDFLGMRPIRLFGNGSSKSYELSLLIYQLSNFTIFFKNMINQPISNRFYKI